MDATSNMIKRLLTNKCYVAHKATFIKWPYGKPVKSWYDEHENICVSYEYGRWFHYKITPNGISWS